MTSCAANSISMITSYTPGITYPTHDDYLYSVITCPTGATYPTHDDYLHPIKSGTGGTTLVAAVWGSSFATARIGTTGSTFAIARVGTTGSIFAIAQVGTTDSTVLTFPFFQISFRLFLQPAITRMSGVFPMPVWSRFFHSRFFCEVHHD